MDTCDGVQLIESIHFILQIIFVRETKCSGCDYVEMIYSRK